MRESSLPYLQFISENTTAYDDMPYMEVLKQRCFLVESQAYFDEEGHPLYWYNGKPIKGYQKAFLLQTQAEKHADSIFLWEMEPVCGHNNCLNIMHWQFKKDSMPVNKRLYTQFLKLMLKEGKELQWEESGSKSLVRYQNRLEYTLVNKLLDGCWKPKSGIQSNGYSKMSLQSKQYPMHQAAFMLFRHSSLAEKELIRWEDIYDPDKPIHHTCANIWCVNPDHLTQEEIPIHSIERDMYTGKNQVVTKMKKRPRARPLSENLSASVLIDQLGRPIVEDIINLIDEVKGMSPVGVLSKYNISMTTYEFIHLNREKFKTLFHKMDQEN